MTEKTLVPWEPDPREFSTESVTTHQAKTHTIDTWCLKEL